MMSYKLKRAFGLLVFVPYLIGAFFPGFSGQINKNHAQLAVIFYFTVIYSTKKNMGDEKPFSISLQAPITQPPGKQEKAPASASASASASDRPVSDQDRPQSLNPKRSCSASSGSCSDNNSPPPQPPAKKCKREGHQALLQEMDKVLERIKSSVEADENRKKIVFILDLDGTLITPFHKLSPSLGLNQESSISVQQCWIDQLGKFLSLNNALFLMIYNTSRSHVLLDEKISSHHPISLNTKWNGKPKFLLPPPSVVITNTGGHLSLPVEMQSIVDYSKVIAINHNLQTWIDNDKKYFKYAIEDIENPRSGKSISSRPYFYIENLDIKAWVLTNYFMSRNAYSQITLTFFMKDEESVSRALLQNVTINKGTGSRLALELLEKGGLLTPGRYWIVVSGNNELDLPMLRPDLEAGASVYTEPSTLLNRDCRLSAIGISKTPEDVASHWLLSIITDPEHLSELQNPHVRKAMYHPKVVSIKGHGLLGIMKSVAERLELNKDSDTTGPGQTSTAQ